MQPVVQKGAVGAVPGGLMTMRVPCGVLVIQIACTIAAHAQAPVPGISSLQKDEPVIGEWAYITVNAVNNGGGSDDGGITVSFPNFRSASDLSQLDVVASDGTTAIYEPGQIIHSNTCAEMLAQSAMVELYDADWGSQKTHHLVVRVKPAATGAFPVRVRSAMHVPGTSTCAYVNYPSTGVRDQQGWSCLDATLNVSTNLGPYFTMGDSYVAITADGLTSWYGANGTNSPALPASIQANELRITAADIKSWPGWDSRGACDRMDLFTRNGPAVSFHGDAMPFLENTGDGDKWSLSASVGPFHPGDSIEFFFMGQSDRISSDSGNYVFQNWDSNHGSNYVVRVTRPGSSFLVSVQDQNGQARPGAKVVKYQGALITSNVTDASGQTVFSNLATGASCSLEAYFEGSNPFDDLGELWAATSVTASTGSMQVVLRREWPYTEDIRLYRGHETTRFEDGSVLPAGTQVREEIVVRNPGVLARQVQVTARYANAPGHDAILDEQVSAAVTVGAQSICIVTNFFNPAPGAVCDKAVLTKTRLADGRDVKTDAWDWGPAFSSVSAVSFSGKVTSANSPGYGVPDVGMTWGDHATITDANGFYRFENLPCGTHNLVAEKYGYFTHSEVFSPICNGTNSKDVVLDKDLDPYGLAAYDEARLLPKLSMYNRGVLHDLDVVEHEGLHATQGVPVGPDSRNLVILIHGHNLSGATNAFGNGYYAQLAQALSSAVNDSRWTFIAYNWANDANNYLPDTSAEMAYQHGLMIAKKLGQQVGYMNIDHLHLIAHSAGAWAAYGAARALWPVTRPDVNLQVTYLDPFIPAEIVLLASSLDRQQLSMTAFCTKTLYPGAASAEVYWSDDVTDLDWPLPFQGVTQPHWQWNWPGYMAEVDLWSGIPVFNPWWGHGGPCVFYADAINNPYNSDIHDGAGWRFSQYWNWLHRSASRIITVSGNLDFGDVPVGSSRTAVLQIANSGNEPLHVMSISWPAGFSGAWSGAVDAGACSNVLVTFAPQTTGHFGDSGGVESDATSGQTSIRCSGTGLPPSDPQIVVEGRGVAIADGETAASTNKDTLWGALPVGVVSSRTFAIRNAGGTPLALTGSPLVSLSGAEPSNFEVAGEPATTINPGEATTFVVKFAPRSVGGHTATVVIANNDSSKTPFDFAVAGQATPAPLPIIALAGSLSFGNVPMGLISSRALTFSNAGSAVLHVQGVSFPPAFTGTWPSAIAPGAATNMQVRFQPTASGPFGGPVTVLSDAASGISNVQCTGTGLLSQVETGSLVVIVQDTRGTPRGGAHVTRSNGVISVTNVADGAGVTQFGGMEQGSNYVLVASYSHTNAFDTTDELWAISRYTHTSVWTVAADSACSPAYNTGGYRAANGGYGFGPWQVSPATNDSRCGCFVGDSDFNGSGLGPGIDCATNRAWALYANSNALVDAKRVFSSGALGSGRVFSVEIDTGWHDGTNTSAGFGLQDSDGVNRFEFFHLAGRTNYSINDQSTAFDTGVPWTEGGLSLSVMMGASSNYTLQVVRKAGGAAAFSRSFANGLPVDRVRFFYYSSFASGGASRDFFFNNLSIQSNATPYVTLRRDFPSLHDVHLVVASNAEALAMGATVSVAQSLGLVVEVVNGRSNSCDVAVRLLIDRDRQPPYDGDFTSGFRSIPGAGAVTAFAFTNEIQQTGTYYWAERTDDQLVQKTDATDWSPAFTAVEEDTQGVARVIALGGNLSYGGVTAGVAATRFLTISNGGAAPLTVTNVLCPPGFVGAWSGVLASTVSTNIPIQFIPADTGTYEGVIIVQSDATTGRDNIACSGAGLRVETRVMGISGSLSFGAVTYGKAATLAMTITNAGNSPLTISSIDYPAHFSGVWPTIVAPGSSTNASVTFGPHALGPLGGMITIHSDATSGTSNWICSGTGVGSPNGEIELAGELDFGWVPLGQSATQDVVVANGGSTPLSVTGLLLPQGFTSTWVGTVDAGSRITSSITFLPAHAGIHSGTMVVMSDAVAGTNSLLCSGFGEVRVSGMAVSNQGVDFTYFLTLGESVRLVRADSLLPDDWSDGTIIIGTGVRTNIVVPVGTQSWGFFRFSR